MHRGTAEVRVARARLIRRAVFIFGEGAERRDRCWVWVSQIDGNIGSDRNAPRSREAAGSDSREVRGMLDWAPVSPAFGTGVGLVALSIR
jgi:hypothetical protein